MPHLQVNKRVAIYTAFLLPNASQRDEVISFSNETSALFSAAYVLIKSLPFKSSTKGKIISYQVEIVFAFIGLHPRDSSRADRHNSSCGRMLA